MNLETTMTRTFRPSTPKEPRRTCVVCHVEEPKDRLVRFVRTPEGEVFPDLKSSSVGRGAWAHPSPECLKRLDVALAKSFRAAIVTPTTEIVLRLAQAGDQRVRHLLGAARRQRLLAVGADATEEAGESGDAALIVLARDARSAAELSVVRTHLPLGKVRVWGTKDGLGRLLGRQEVAVLAVVDERLATGLFDAIAMALLVPPTALEEAYGEARTEGPGTIVSTEVE